MAVRPQSGSGPPAASPVARVAGLVRLTHPFPSLLDGAATLAIALLAGGAVPTAARLAIAMVCLQAAIGAVNDIVDAPRDAGRKPGKPIPAGLIPVPLAVGVALGAGIGGLALSAVSGPATVVVGTGILAIGLLYDLALRGTAWSWLPFALGIPLLPVFAWLGAVGRLPALFAVLVPVAFLAGAALAIANSLADVERDRDSGSSSVADRLGAARAWAVHAALQALVGAVALGTLFGARAGGLPLVAASVAAVVVAVGVGLGGSAAAGRRERGWELEAIGVAGLAAAWIAGLAPIAG